MREYYSVHEIHEISGRTDPPGSVSLPLKTSSNNFYPLWLSHRHRGCPCLVGTESKGSEHFQSIYWKKANFGTKNTGFMLFLNSEKFLVGNLEIL